MATRRLATVLSIDVVGFSRLMQSDASGLLSVLNTIFRLTVKPEVEAHNGRIIKLLGDGALVEFSSAYEALVCADNIQRKMRSREPPYDYETQIFMRMGIHAGDVLVEGDDIFGDGVNIAARLQSEAEAGGVLVSRMIADLAGSDLPFKLRREGNRSLKNISSPVETLSIDFTDKNVELTRSKQAQSLEIRFCKSVDGQGLAWTSVGDGPVIVKAPNWIGHLEHDWHHPGLTHVFDSLSRHHRVIYFDSRGNGLSDWDMDEVTFELMVEDLKTVFDAAGVDRAPVLGMSQGCAIAAAFAARYPERVSAILMFGGFAEGRAKRKSAKDQERAKAMQAMMTAGWDDDYPSMRDLIADVIVPEASLEDRRHYAEIMRDMISPENMGRYREALDNFDVTDLLPQVKAPCLVMHCKGDRMQPIEQGRKLAAGIPNARFIAYDSNNHVLTENDPCWPLAEHEMLNFLSDTD